MIVQYFPVDEKAALVLDGHGILPVVHAQAAHFVAAEALLDFPAGHVGIHEGGLFRGDEGGARTDDQDIGSRTAEFLPDGGDFRRVEEILHPEVRHISEQDVVRHEGSRQAADLLLGLHELPHPDDPAEAGFQGCGEFRFMYACIPVDRKGAVSVLAQHFPDGVPPPEKPPVNPGGRELIIVGFPHSMYGHSFSLCKYIKDFPNT